jgi:hypothetical protein
MKTNIATDRSQSQRLLRCGVSADTAGMCYDSGALSLMDYDSAVHERDSRRESYEVIPAWSLSTLLGLIPHVIEVYDDGDYYFSLAQEFPASEDYHAAYKYCWADDDAMVGRRSSCPIEACVQLIEWLIENNYKLNEIN